MPSSPRLPNDQQRLAIIGATGSGKTQAALWHLSHRNFDLQPWVIYNFKGDESIDAIPYAKSLPVDAIPNEPGVFITRPVPEDDDDAVSAQMKAIWARGHTGVWVDEGYMIAKSNRPFRALLTQGRSKYVPMIVASQRPVWMDRFTFSESEFFQVFRLQHKDDRKSMSQIVPVNFDVQLPPYHSYYYDAGANVTTVMRPVPDIRAIHGTFAARLSRLQNRQRRVV